MKSLIVLGTRGIPASHGGFETFAERLALYLVTQNWEVTVYCQTDSSKNDVIVEEVWNGITLIDIPIKLSNTAWASILFDWRSILHASKRDGLILILGYNTACFSLFHRLTGRIVLFNMDGLEWKRKKWGWHEKLWLYFNERTACLLGKHLIADNPEIRKHLLTRVAEKKVTMIPYGADFIQNSDTKVLNQIGIKVQEYALIIARIEPENSIIEMVQAFSAKQRSKKLIVLGKLEPKLNPYHLQVINAANDSVLFLGAIYDPAVVCSLRHNCLFYMHGHQVGGTNPSLVESMGAGAAILAHKNPYNYWVAGLSARYFEGTEDCLREINSLFSADAELKQMRIDITARFLEEFQWHFVLQRYKKMLSNFI